MRRAALLIAAILTGLSNAPTPGAAQSTLLARGGVNIASLGGDDTAGIDSRTALRIEGAVVFDLAENIGVQVGGAYAQKGFSVSEQGIDVTFRLDYVEIPALIRFAIPSAGALSPRFVAGPALAIKAGCDLRVQAEGVTVTVPCSEGDVDVETMDLGLMGGAGLSIATAGSLSITLDVLYNLGLVGIVDPGLGGDYKNRAWSIVAGIAWPLG